MRPPIPVRLIHGRAAAAAERAGWLAALGYAADASPFRGPDSLRQLRAAAPAAVVIDLARAPAQGRDVALALRSDRRTRHLPLVFVGGEPAKVEATRALLPDATYTTWEVLAADLACAIASPPVDPVVPSSRLAGYSGTPLPSKLGIRRGTRVLIEGAPAGFEALLAELPAGAAVRRGPGVQEEAAGAVVRPAADLILWFVRSHRELAAGLAERATALGRGHLWICWPKKASGVATDLGEAVVRESGLAAGLVDFKICAVDATWSGLLFSRRRR